MTELWLKLNTDDGETKRVKVDREEFIIGRHSESGLSIPVSSVSRQHLKINRFGDVFVVSDCESTLGTKINGEDLSEPVGLKDGDVLKLGETIEIGIEIESDQEETAEEKSAEAGADESPAAAGSSFPKSLFYVLPIFGLIVLLCAGGGLIYMFSGDGGKSRAGKDKDPVADSSDDSGGRTKKPGKSNKETPDAESPGQTQPTQSNSSPADNTTGQPDIPPLPKSSSELDKVRTYSAAFLSRIVVKDPDAFLLDRQLQQVAPSVSKLKSSSAVAANIGQAKKDSAKIAAIAAEKGVKPDFLAAASIAKLGNNRGDVVATAQTMAGILQKLQTVIGVESADEATIVIAAYYQGEAGSFEKMQGTLEGLTKGNTEGLSARQIRTIWFLNEKGKLKPDEFDLALRFIAIGTIMQKPDDFGVKV